MALRSEQEGSALRLKGLEKQYRVARQEKEDFHKVAGDCCAEGTGRARSACSVWHSLGEAPRTVAPQLPCFQRDAWSPQSVQRRPC